MSTGVESDVIRSATSTDPAGTAHDAGTPAATPPVPTVSTPSTSSAPPATPAVSAAPPSKPEVSAPDDDPVRAAIDRLATKDDRPRDEQGRFAPQKAGASEIPAPKAQSPAKPAVPAETGTPSKPDATKPPEASPGVDVDPYHGFDERGKAEMRQRTRERIEDLHGRWANAEKQLKELQAKAPEPDQLNTLISEYELGQDVPFVPAEHLAGLVVSQAAVTRAMMAMEQGRLPAPNDLKVASDFFGRIDGIRGSLGLTPQQQPPAQAEIQPFVGNLPTDMQDLIDVYGLPEADVRMLAALKGRQQRPSNQQQRSVPPAASAPAVPQPAPQQQRGVGVDMNLLYGQRLIAELSRDGVKPEMVQAHYQVLLPLAAQLTQQKFPTVPAERIPAVFDALPPDQRYSIMVEAHKSHRVSQTKASRPSAPPPLPPATNQGPLNGSSPRVSAPAANGDPVSAAIAYLSR